MELFVTQEHYTSSKYALNLKVVSVRVTPSAPFFSISSNLVTNRRSSLSSSKKILALAIAIAAVATASSPIASTNAPTPSLARPAIAPANVDTFEFFDVVNRADCTHVLQCYSVSRIVRYFSEKDTHRLQQLSDLSISNLHYLQSHVSLTPPLTRRMQERPPCPCSGMLAGTTVPTVLYLPLETL